MTFFQHKAIKLKTFKYWSWRIFFQFDLYAGLLLYGNFDKTTNVKIDISKKFKYRQSDEKRSNKDDEENFEENVWCRDVPFHPMNGTEVTEVSKPVFDH